MVHVETSVELERPAIEVLEDIFEAKNWVSFTGHGFIPAIRSVSITPGQASRVGTRFDVTNADGSTHAETVTLYEPGKRLELRMDGFSRPLSMFADHFIESWRVEGALLRREFQLVPRNVLGSLMLRIVKHSLRRAVEKQNQAMAQNQAE